MTPKKTNEKTQTPSISRKRGFQTNFEEVGSENIDSNNTIMIEQSLSILQNDMPNFDSFGQTDKTNKRQKRINSSENFDNSNSIFSRVWSWLTEYKGPPSVHLSDTPTQGFLNLINIADKNLNSKVIFTSDQFFGATSNLLEPTEPKPIEADETNIKMDAWLTQRRREKGHDWCVIELSAPAVIYGFEIDLRHLGMEKVPRLSVEAAFCPELSSAVIPKEDEDTQLGSFEYNRRVDKFFDEILKANGTGWIDLIDSVQACFDDQTKESQPHYFSVEDPQLRVPFTHLRINLFPDGGISRFRVYGLPQFNIANLIDNTINPIINLLDYENGACLLTFSEATLLNGHPKFIISESCQNRRWETKRNFNRRPIVSDNPCLIETEGDWAIFKFVGRAILESISLSFKGLDGRIPQKLIIQVLDTKTTSFKDYLHEQKQFSSQDHKGTSSPWRMLTDITIKDAEIIKSDLKKQYPHWSKRIATHVRLIMIPDGGISTVSIMGSLVRSDLS